MLPFKRIGANRYHGMYYTWNSMFVRCYYPSHTKYKDYGGRGITVAPEWFNFQMFVLHVYMELGKRPSKKHSIDRINNNKGYVPGNIRWATKRQQEANKRRGNKQC